MRRVHGWVALGAGAALVLPLGVQAAAASGAVRAALPVPVAAQPRLGFVERSDHLESVTLDAPDPAGTASFGAASSGTASSAAGGPRGLAMLAGSLPAYAPVWDPRTYRGVRDLTTGHRHDGQASVTTTLRTPVVTWVSTAGPQDAVPSGPSPSGPSPSGPPSSSIPRSGPLSGSPGASAGPARASSLAVDASAADGPADGSADGSAVAAAAEPAPDPGDVYVAVLDPNLVATPTRDRQVTCDPATETHPVLSPDGTRIAFATDARGEWDIAVAPVPAAGQECDPSAVQYVTGLGTQDTWPTWLDERQLVYSGARDGERPDLYAVAVDGTPLGRLTQTPDVSETQPDAQPISGGWEVVLTTTEFRPDGSLALLTVSESPGLPSTLTDPYTSFTRPQGSEGRWSPQGQIAFTSTDSDPEGDVWVTRWLHQEDGSIRVEGQGRVAGDPGVADSHPTWVVDQPGGDFSGDFAQLVYTSEVASTDVADVVADDGSDLRPIENLGSTWADFQLAEAGIDYSPDGTQVAYSAPTPLEDTGSPSPTPSAGGPPPQVETQAGYGQHLVLADATTLDAVELPYQYDEDDIDLDPTWSPDGRRIAFVRTMLRGEEWDTPQVWVLDLETLELEQVTDPGDGSTWAVDPSWSPDGTRLVLATGSGEVVPGTSGTNNGSYLAVVDVATRASTRLEVEFPGCDPYGGSCTFPAQGRSPDWSPDGTQIAAADLVVVPTWFRGGYSGSDDFTDPRQIEAPGAIGVLQLASPDGAPELVSARALTGVAPDGTGTPTVTQVARADDPEWSPDGTRIAFSQVPVGQPWDQRSIAEVAAADGSELRLVTDPPGPQREPAYQPWADLGISLTSTPVTTDGTATLTVTLTNAGPGLLADPTVTVELPDGVTTPGAPGCTVNGSEVVCTLDEPLDRDASVPIDLPVQDVPSATPSTVTAVGTSPSPDSDVEDNTATVTIQAPRPGLAGGVNVSVTLSSPVAWVGGLPVTETITVRNAGSLPVENVTLTTTYPGTVTPTGLAPCPAPTGSCDLGTLPGADSRVFTVTLTPDHPFDGPPQVDDVHVAVTTTSPDPNPANNDAGAPLEVRSPKVELRPGVARPGEVVFAVGTDFPPGDVRLAWSTGVMSVQRPVAVQPDGTWRLAVPIIRDTLVTDRNLLASSTLTPATFGPVSAPLLIVPTSVDAPTFLFRK